MKFWNYFNLVILDQFKNGVWTEQMTRVKQFCFIFIWFDMMPVASCRCLVCVCVWYFSFIFLFYSLFKRTGSPFVSAFARVSIPFRMIYLCNSRSNHNFSVDFPIFSSVWGLSLEIQLNQIQANKNWSAIHGSCTVFKP